MAAAVFFLNPLLTFYPTRFYHRGIIALGPKNDSNSSPRNDGPGFPSTQERKTPPPKESVAEQIRSSVQSTPLSNHAPTVNPTANPDHLVADFDRYILEDLRIRVFISADHYFSNILHLPDDWRMNDEIKSKIEAVKNDVVFENHVKTYVALCNQSSPGEKTFYHPHSLMCNSAFDVLGATEDSRLGIYRQDAKSVDGGLEKNIPDTLGVLRAMFNSSGNVVDNMEDKGPEDNFSWAQTMHWQEFKPNEYYLDEGTKATYRFITPEDEDPKGEVRGKTTVSRDPGGILPPVKSRTGSTSKKRRSEDETPHVDSKYRRSGTAPDVSQARRGTDESVALSSVKEGIAAKDIAEREEEETQARRAAHLQCGRYALEMLSSAGFRTHCIGALVTVGRIQPLYYDHSVIIVCKPIDMFKSRGKRPKITEEDVTNEFAAMLVGLGGLTLKQRGIQEEFCDDRALIENHKAYMRRCSNPKDKKKFDKTAMFVGVKLKLKSGEDEENVEVILGRILSRQPGIVGRNTCVVEATSEHDEWKDKELVVKISWPATSRKSEAEFVIKAREKARSMPDWALDHLPDILLSQDFDHSADSTQANLVAFFAKAMFAEEEKFEYEKRVCRITVQERLYPLEELRTVQEYAQVFFDILQIHKWLYDHPGILHRDISPRNIMWRRTVDGHLRGVLNDFDLSAYRHETGPSSRQRTGTLPYMAFELLINDENGHPPKHLYRHDVESIFYVILLLCCRYKVVAIQDPDGRPILERTQVHSPFDSWYKLGRDGLKDTKIAFFTGHNSFSPVVSSGFTDFQPWINRIRQHFLLGFHAQDHHNLYKDVGATGSFDDETLQACVSYSAIVETCS
ncbi:uncharacterized protein BT62DRAFT_973413 [Guyanagaster necrorhizus]|uniref:Protein kinase domain-containing protein n=1 Tax=Guyanagaster necrorhizus TaxID=856835 RepID=A0A9P8AQC7_9AGAR|nr:uncharacterized protein BT62DRAFT_973413 [Guyanagaster necrorhizus MCA 3950]KAG7442732.1 hypothetical protein BT62DRAFT_973413 [Guyanagaster necrorhizus MCA 3950]